MVKDAERPKFGPMDHGTSMTLESGRFSCQEILNRLENSGKVRDMWTIFAGNGKNTGK